MTVSWLREGDGPEWADMHVMCPRGEEKITPHIVGALPRVPEYRSKLSHIFLWRTGPIHFIIHTFVQSEIIDETLSTKLPELTVAYREIHGESLPFQNMARDDAPF